MPGKHNAAARVRALEPADRADWFAMRCRLWPGHGEDFLLEIDAYLRDEASMIKQVLVCQVQDTVTGFLEMSLRNYAEGASGVRVPYVEGWYVRDAWRGQGHGALLMEGAQRWAAANGYCELASDAEIDNHASIAAHGALGFSETDRIVCFLKKFTRGT